MSVRTDRKPKSELRHWSTYASVGEWYEDYHGYVPSMMAVGLSQLMRQRPELTFPAAYASLRGAGRIIELHSEDQPRCEVCSEHLDCQPDPGARLHNRPELPVHRRRAALVHAGGRDRGRHQRRTGPKGPARDRLSPRTDPSRAPPGRSHGEPGLPGRSGQRRCLSPARRAPDGAQSEAGRGEGQ